MSINIDTLSLKGTEQTLRFLDNYFNVQLYAFIFDVYIVYVKDKNTKNQQVLGVEIRIRGDYKSIHSNCTSYADSGFFPLQHRIKNCLHSYFQNGSPKVEILDTGGASTRYKDSSWIGVVKFFPPENDFRNNFNDIGKLKTQIGNIPEGDYEDDVNAPEEIYRGKYGKEKVLFDFPSFAQGDRVKDKQLFTKKLGFVSFSVKCPVQSFKHMHAALTESEEDGRPFRKYTAPSKTSGDGFKSDLARLNEGYFTKKVDMVNGRKYNEYVMQKDGKFHKSIEQYVYDAESVMNFITESGGANLEYAVKVEDKVSGEKFEAFLGFVAVR